MRGWRASTTPLFTLLLCGETVSIALAASIIESVAGIGGLVIEVLQFVAVARPHHSRQHAQVCAQNSRFITYNSSLLVLLVI